MSDELRYALETALGSQYAVQRLLGHGGMGAVYLATERSLERPVAIKVLSPEVSAAVENTERFRREARIAGKLAHPNIVPLYAFGEVDGLWYYVMGYVPGGSLAERLSFEGRLRFDVVHRIVSELADALDYAHRQGVIHRDIKPANVLLEEDSGRPMLADFGIARSIDAKERLTAPGRVIGTPSYMSPEQALGVPELDGRSDIYSLGVLAYEMLTGREPFTEGTLLKAAFSHTVPQSRPLEESVPGIPPNLAAVVERCLARDPGERWPDARSLKGALGHGDATETAAPTELRDLPGFGTLATLWGLVWGALAIANYRSPAEAGLCALLALIVPIGLLLDVWSVRRPGLRAPEVVRVAFWPPMWWGLWWPRALRRRGDLWDRLPGIARRARITITTFVFGAPLLLLLANITLPAPIGEALAARPWWFVAAAGALVLTLLVALAAVAWWGRARELSVLEMVRLVHGPTIVSAYWAAPRMARLLAAPRTPDDESSRPRSPHDLLRAIADLSQSLTGTARALGDGATADARRLVARIEILDAEIAALGHDVDSGEIARLEGKLVAMGYGAGTVDEQRQMREVVLRQLDLMRRMRAQVELAAGRRAHLAGLLHRLWARLTERVSHGADGAAVTRELDERLRAICAEVGGQADDAMTPAPSEATDSAAASDSQARRG